MPYNLAEQESQALRNGPLYDMLVPFKRAQAMRRVEEKIFDPIGTALTTALSPVTAFVVSGLVIAKVVGISNAALASTSTTGTLAVGVSGATTVALGTTTINGTNFPAANTVWIDTSPTVLAEVMVAANLTGFLTASNIIVTVATNNMTTGGLYLYCIWEPVSPNASVTAT